MRGDELTVDEREQRIVSDERLIARIRARQIRDLEALDAAQVATADGSRSLSEWVAARCDVSLDTARSLVRTMRRVSSRDDLRETLASGEVTFDRVEAVSRIPEGVGLMEHLDVGGVRREAAMRVRITATDESKSMNDSYLVMQPSLDESWWKGHFGLDGYLGSVVDKAISEKADQLSDLPDGSKGSSAWRRAMALGELAMSDDTPPAQLTVFVDATQAAETGGETGVVLEAGPRVGRETLQAILCDADVEVIARTEDGRYLDYGRRTRTAPPALRRALLDKYVGRCAADGCDSRHRLQAHHILPWAQGGRTDQDKLVLLCWFHHHIVVHRWDYHIYTHPETGRIRFRRPPRREPEYEPKM